MTNILLIDDDIELVNMLSEYLAAEGFNTVVAYDGTSGIKEALSQKYDLAVIDIMMPNVNGFAVLNLIRQHSQLPVIMLTARGDDEDRVTGLEMGADDYVQKPSTSRELVARIRAILRRTRINETGKNIVIDTLVLCPGSRSVTLDNHSVYLTSSEFNMLEILARNVGHVVHKKELSLQGLAKPLQRFDRSVDVHVSKLRQKLGSHPDGLPWIRTIRGQGYLLTQDEQ